jgi:putative ABC transport system ATP-binding protein
VSEEDTAPQVQTQRLTKIYSHGDIRVIALRDVSFELQEGGFLGIAGASGSGKSTLLNCLGGLDTPSEGRILVDGKEISRLGKEDLAHYRRHTVGMIFQSFHLLSDYTALENVAFPLLFAGIPKTKRLARAANILDLVGLSARMGHKPAELSGGEQQRVAIARALINQPRILLADEPTGNLDSRTSVEIVGLLSKLHAQGLTVMMVSHEEDLLGGAAGKIIRLRDGEICGQAGS